MNTKLTYVYDASGGKTSQSVVLSGELAREDIDDIARTLHQGRLFIPDQIGLTSLAQGNEDDHVWHSLDLASAKPTLERANAPLTAAELADNFREVVWDVTEATSRLYDCAPQRRSMR